MLRYRSRFVGLIETLLAHSDILVNDFYVPAPCKKADVEGVEAKLGRPLDPSIVEFYTEMNGLELRWFHKNRDASHLGRIRRNFEWRSLREQGRRAEADAILRKPAPASFDPTEFPKLRDQHYEESSKFAQWRKRTGTKVNQLTFTGMGGAMASGTINIRPIQEVFLAKNKFWARTVKTFLKGGVGEMKADVCGRNVDYKTLFTTVLKPFDLVHEATQVVLAYSEAKGAHHARLLGDYFADATAPSMEIGFDAYLDALIGAYGFRSFERDLFQGRTPSPISLDALPS